MIWQDLTRRSARSKCVCVCVCVCVCARACVRVCARARPEQRPGGATDSPEAHRAGSGGLGRRCHRGLVGSVTLACNLSI